MIKDYDFNLEEIDELIKHEVHDFATGKIHDINLKEAKIEIEKFPLIIQYSVFKNDPVIRKLAIKSDFRVICIEDFDPIEEEIILCLAMMDDYGSDLVYNSVEPYDMIWDLLESMYKKDPIEYKFIGDLIRLEKLKDI